MTTPRSVPFDRPCISRQHKGQLALSLGFKEEAQDLLAHDGMGLVELQGQIPRGLVDLNGRVAHLLAQGREAVAHGHMGVDMNLERCRPGQLLTLPLQKAVQQVKGVGQGFDLACFGEGLPLATTFGWEEAGQGAKACHIEGHAILHEAPKPLRVILRKE